MKNIAFRAPVTGLKNSGSVEQFVMMPSPYRIGLILSMDDEFRSLIVDALRQVDDDDEIATSLKVRTRGEHPARGVTIKYKNQLGRIIELCDVYISWFEQEGCWIARCQGVDEGYFVDASLRKVAK